ncbi:MAG: hypothetical protein H6838_07105 [Planctomycetes bacterium]|nr:hypothetical protein [Planctomycetota bacterium]MCB9885242.1 hypothetical protein [Planctomycetota bacterium]
MLRPLLLLLPALLTGALCAQAPAANEAGKVVVVVKSHSPVFRHVGARAHRYVIPADRQVGGEAAARRAHQQRPAASLRHLKGR